VGNSGRPGHSIAGAMSRLRHNRGGLRQP